MTFAYTRRLAAAAVAQSTAVVTLATVPESELWVLRDVTAFHGLSTTHNLRVLLNRNPGGFLYMASIPVVGETSGHLDLRQVLNPGDQLCVQSLTAAIQCYLTGYVFHS